MTANEIGGRTDGGRSAPSAVDVAMERYASGDDAAFEEVYDGLAPRLLAYLSRQMRDHARGEDLLQQTLLQIHRARGRFLPGAEVLPWAFAIARRLMIDCVRHDKRRGTVAFEDHAQAVNVSDGAAGAYELVHADQLARRVDAELARLPPCQREAFILLKHEGLTLQQAADVLGVTVTAVKLRAHRAYDALRAVLADEAPAVLPATVATETPARPVVQVRP